MCTLADFEKLSMVPPWNHFLKSELANWHRITPYVTGTVVDMGAGCGETAQFYLLHGAERVICFENDPRALKCLYANFGEDSRVIIHPFTVNHFKADIEGSERGSIVETHFPVRFHRMDRGTPSPHYRIEAKTLTGVDRLRISMEKQAHAIIGGLKR